MNENYKLIAQKPVFFERNRVFRVYTGGKLFHDFFGDADEDGSLPEEWVASYVRALNLKSSHPKEGVSKIKGEDVYFDDLIGDQKELMLGERDNLGILLKVLDSAIRLPVQAHPDKPFSNKHFNSNFGKAESWVILATRKDARIYFGFKEEITKEQFQDAIKRSETDKTAMEELLNMIPVEPGDVYFIPAKVVHAIGYGCLILELQEPTDFTVQPEAWCGDYRLNDYEMYLGLDHDTALECFDYSIYGDKAIKLGKRLPRIIIDEGDIVSEELIGADETDCFSMIRHKIKEGTLKGINAPAVYIATEGEGTLTSPDGSTFTVSKGDYFFMPYCIDKKYSVSGNSLEIIECLPPEKF